MFRTWRRSRACWRCPRTSTRTRCDGSPAEESARSSFDEAAEAIDKRTGAHVPKRQVEALSVRAAQDFDSFYADRMREPETGDQLVVLTFDDKGIAMRHADLREATRKAAETTPRPLHSRLTKGEKPNRKRMAHVAAVYSLDKWPRTIADVLHGLHDPEAARREATAAGQQAACGRASSTPAKR